MPNNKEEKTLIGKAQRVKKLLQIANFELDELIEGLQDPTVLHAELTSQSKKVEHKIDRVLDIMIDVKRSTRS